MKKLLIGGVIITLLIVALGCSNGGNKPPTNGPQNNSQNMKAIPVITEIVQFRDLDRFIFITGKLEGITDITLSSETNGRVEEVYKKLGDWVEKGEELGRIDNTYYRIKLEQAQAYLLSAEADFEFASIQMQTSETLYSDGRISQSEYIQMKSNHKKAQAGLNEAKANVEISEKNYDNSRFIAPVSGYITDISIEVGEMITSGMPVCSLVNSKQLIIKTGVSESDVTWIKKGQNVDVYYQPFNKTYAGTIKGLGIKPKAGTASYPIEIVLDNKDSDLYPGMVIKAKVLSKTFKNVIYTSINNVVEEFDQQYVYIVDENKKAKKVKVELGEKIERYVIINSGVNPGDELVIEGFENLDDGVSVEIRKGL